MLADNQGGFPKTLGGLFDTAGSLFLRRFALYAGLAVAIFVLQLLFDVLAPHTEGTAQAISIALDAYLAAAVSIGVAADLRGTATSSRAILLGALSRWGVVTAVGLVLWLLTITLFPAVYGPPDQSGYGLFILPVIVIWGTTSLATVVAAIEPAESRLMLPFIALGRGLSLGLQTTNMGRLVVLSIVLAIPGLLALVLNDQLTMRHVGNAPFWADVPLDALLSGPLQALLTVFYLDFVRRAKR